MSESSVYVPEKLKTIEYRLSKAEECIEKESDERKEIDKVIFSKLDKMGDMIIYQLCAAILTLIIIIAMFVTK